jgi:hypothetical protein
MSRDITWLKQQYGTWQNLSVEQISKILPSDSAHDDGDIEYPDNNTENTKINKTTTTTEAPPSHKTQVNQEPNTVDTNQNLPNTCTANDTNIIKVCESESNMNPNPKLTRVIKRLQGFFNPTATAHVIHQTRSLPHHSGEGNNLSGNQMNEQNPNSQTTNETTTHDSNNILLDREHFDFTFLGFTPAPDESQYSQIYDAPTTFDEAWDHEDKSQREKW